MFDIEKWNWDRLWPIEVENLVKRYWILTPKIFDCILNPTQEQIYKYVWQSTIWPVGEWVVLKNTDYINKFWDKVYAKVLSDKFK